MIAVVAPRLQVKFSPFGVYSSESAKRNAAFLKVTTFSDAAGNHTFFVHKSFAKDLCHTDCITF